MKYYFCLVSDQDRITGTNIGKTYAYKNRSKWIPGGNDIHNYLTAGYMKGVDFVVVEGKAYMIMKSYIDLTENFVVIVCVESVAGCDN